MVKKMAEEQKTKTTNWRIFKASIFFVLGFSIVFAVVGVLLQTVLLKVGYTVQQWLGYVGGVIIIFFGLYILGLIKPKFLQQEHKFKVKKFSSTYITSFVFGAAFAVGWTPCVTAALGAILGLAASQPGSAFFLLMAYTVGLGLPFLVVGLFSSRAQSIIRKAAPWLKYVNFVFGIILIALGVLIFTGSLTRVANIDPITNFFGTGDNTLGQNIKGISIVNILIAGLAGLVSFLSPCVLPLVPGFLSFLASVTTKPKNETKTQQ